MRRDATARKFAQPEVDRYHGPITQTQQSAKHAPASDFPERGDAAGASRFHVDMPEKRQKRWLRRLKWPGIILAALLVLIYGILPLIMTPMIRSRLQKQIST